MVLLDGFEIVGDLPAGVSGGSALVGADIFGLSAGGFVEVEFREMGGVGGVEAG